MWARTVLVAVLLIGVGRASLATEDTGRAADRMEMVAEQIVRRGVDEPRVLAALRAVPRHRFVPERLRAAAYDDNPLPIGYGQTISQPYIVAKMTELLGLTAASKLFELGTGSGYQAAVAARLAAHVYTMEIHAPLAERARATLAELGYANVTVRTGDGYYGWPEHAPFDAIIVTAAASHIPSPLVAQLAPGGRMVVPVGPAFATQRLMVVEKAADGAITTRALFPVRFVPVTGDHTEP
ncbi:MAG: protein-L-isoaspartate(D-aspartate) O-methyltransferase [Nitrospirota bacterium]|jgi:protein-L-isoaspartate(D-aspartate) O-methyltransferase